MAMYAWIPSAMPVWESYRAALSLLDAVNRAGGNADCR